MYKCKEIQTSCNVAINAKEKLWVNSPALERTCTLRDTWNRLSENKRKPMALIWACWKPEKKNYSSGTEKMTF